MMYIVIKGGELVAIHESGEMYLETILILSQNLPFVRAIDICEEMGYSKPSVSRGLGLLRKGGFIEVDNSGGITLTSDGKNIAQRIYKRHKTLTEFLVLLGVDKETAAADACKIEHDISDTSFLMICKFIERA